MIAEHRSSDVPFCLFAQRKGYVRTDAASVRALESLCNAFYISGKRILKKLIRRLQNAYDPGPATRSHRIFKFAGNFFVRDKAFPSLSVISKITKMDQERQYIVFCEEGAHVISGAAGSRR